METIAFTDVDVLDEDGAGLVCRIAERQVNVPALLLQAGATVRHAGDHGTLVIPRWLGIALGLVSPFPEGFARRGPRRSAAIPRPVVADRSGAA